MSEGTGFSDYENEVALPKGGAICFSALIKFVALTPVK